MFKNCLQVIEIAPAPGLDAEIRNRILSDALKLARHVGYQNAGTVEFLLDSKNNYYFMEVNARLYARNNLITY